MHLYETEFLIAFRFQDFAKKGNVVVFGMESLNAIDNGNNPFDDEILQAIFLIEVSVHVLFH